MFSMFSGFWGLCPRPHPGLPAGDGTPFCPPPKQIPGYAPANAMIDLDLYIKVMSTTASYSPLNISETVKDRGLVPKDHQ